MFDMSDGDSEARHVNTQSPYIIQTVVKRKNVPDPPTSPLLLPPHRTPDMSQMLSNIVCPSEVDMDSKLASWLDKLMTSLTLSATSLDFSLEEELLSPHFRLIVVSH